MVTPWQGDPTIAYLGLRRSNAPVTNAGLRRSLEELGALGYRAVMTPALHPDETQPFFTNGFREVDSLVVLAHDLVSLPAPDTGLDADVVVRRGRRRDIPAIFDLDARAFPRNWRLDQNGLAEARGATPRTHLRVAARRRAVTDPRRRDFDHAPGTAGRPLAYAISGRTRSMAFLQRLATDPDFSGRGMGSSLVLDALVWARRAGCSNLLVNTQPTNRRALGLYESLGFVRSTTRLVVLRCAL